MEKLVEKWLEFRKDWDGTHSKKMGGTTMTMIPQFSDFMDWLALNPTPKQPQEDI